VESVLGFDSLAFDIGAFDIGAFGMGAFGTAHLSPLILSQIEGGLGIGSGFRLWTGLSDGGFGVAIQRMRRDFATKSRACTASCVKLRASHPG